MNQLLNATIEIVEMSDKLGKFGPIKKLKGKNIESGQTNTYTVYKSKQDGTDSAAWTQLQSIAVGDTVSVGYAEQAGTMPDGKPFTSRIVRNFDKDLGNGRKNYVQHNPAPPAQSKPISQNMKPSEPLGRNWEREAYEKCCSIWAAALLGNGKTVTPVELDGFNSLFQAIKKSGEKHFEIKGNIKVNSSEVQAVLDEEVPIDDSDIPF
jgi:hypothetical protein